MKKTEHFRLRWIESLRNQSYYLSLLSIEMDMERTQMQLVLLLGGIYKFPVETTHRPIENTIVKKYRL